MCCQCLVHEQNLGQKVCKKLVSALLVYCRDIRNSSMYDTLIHDIPHLFEVS